LLYLGEFGIWIAMEVMDATDLLPIWIEDHVKKRNPGTLKVQDFRGAMLGKFQDMKRHGSYGCCWSLENGFRFMSELTIIELSRK